MTRIVAGSARGTSLRAPKGAETRPTSDRTKEALFSAVASWFGVAALPPEEQFHDLAVLDLFAGTGGLGLEAASRGAGRVVLVDHRTAPLIRDNARTAGLQVDVRAQKASVALAGLDEPFQLVMLDPPYDLDDTAVDRLLHTLTDRDLVDPDGLVVVERSRRTRAPEWPAAFADTWQRHYGETTLHFGSL